MSAQGLLVQYGCGSSAPPGWLSFDASPTLRFERTPIIGRLYTRNDARFPARARFGDIVAGLPLADGSATLIYASHVLEHLALDDLRIALRNTRRYLAPHGCFRLVVPDLRELAAAYLARDDATAAIDFVRATGLGRAQRPRSWSARLIATLGNSAHLWMWDAMSMTAELRTAGFGEVRSVPHGTFAHPAFADVETADRCVGAVVLEAGG